MAYLRSKTNGHTNQVYYSIVEGRRVDGKVKQVTLEYIGSEEQLKQYVVEAYKLKHQLNNSQKENGSSKEFKKESDSNELSEMQIKTYSHGAVMALYWICELLELKEILSESFSSKTSHSFSREEILIFAVLHRALDPGSKRSFASWVETTSLPYYLKFIPTDLSSQTFWEAMDGITKDEINSAWVKIVNKVFNLFDIKIDNFHLDYTNYFTFIDTNNGRCLVCKRGHNKQKRDDLRQFSLAVLTAFTLNIPIVWDMYEGNKNDKQEFADFMDSIKERLPLLGIDTHNITITFDGGSNSSSNFENLGVHIVCAHSLVSHKDLYDIDLDKYKKIILSNGKERLAYRIPEKRNFSGIEGVGILTFSQTLKDGQVKELEKDLGKAKDTADDVNERLKNTNSRIYTSLKRRKKEFEQEQKANAEYNETIDQEIKKLEAEGKKKRGAPKKKRPIKEWNETEEITGIIEKIVFSGKTYLSEFAKIEVLKQEQYTIKLTIDEQAMDAYTRRKYGKKLTITDHEDWTTKQILEEYARQECIENDIFKLSKDTDHFSVRPQYHWTDDKILVHIFICMTSITICEVLRRYMEESGNHTTKMNMLDILSRVREGWMITTEHKVTRFIEKMNEEEQKYWEIAKNIECKLKTRK